ncbi:MAG: hypothetical protein AAGH60_04515 [Pseudomonadota bacterium]
MPAVSVTLNKSDDDDAELRLCRGLPSVVRAVILALVNAIKMRCA